MSDDGCQCSHRIYRNRQGGEILSENYEVYHSALYTASYFSGYIPDKPGTVYIWKIRKEEHKAAFYDASVSFCHPITGLFPHANAGELFVYTGIASGLQELGLSVGGLAVRYFIVGVIVILIRGILCEKIFAALSK